MKLQMRTYMPVTSRLLPGVTTSNEDSLGTLPFIG